MKMLTFYIIALIAYCGKLYVSGDAYSYDDSQTLDDRKTMVQLFEWTWPSVASECENFLQYYKYGAVHVSPPEEHILLTQTVNGKQDMPWWVKYQPVSYVINSRSGTQQQFTDMVNRCNNVGVRIIVDVVLNHMVGNGQKGYGWAGTFYNTQNNVREFVNYTTSDFNDQYCTSTNGEINYNDANQVTKCQLVGLVDLNQGSDKVRQQQISYLNQLISIGVAGFRIDAAKHMSPDDIQYIVDYVSNLNSTIFGTGNGQKGYGWAGTFYNTQNNVREFVNYTTSDFNDQYCTSTNGEINYNDANQVTKCQLVGLVDLNQGSDKVRQQQISYLNQLISIGVAGFRIDAAKHMSPDDIQYIVDYVSNLNSTIFGTGKRPFVVQEVIDKCDNCEALSGNMYVNSGRVKNFRYGLDLSKAVKRQTNFKYLNNFGPAWNYWSDHDVVVFVDNHDTQRDGSVLNYKDGNNYIMGVTYMLAWSYGYPRVMSSYYFTDNNQGPPTSGTPCWTVTPPSFNTDNTCDSNSGWVCEHRWPAIRRMAAFRSAVMSEAPMNIVTQENRIAFRRGSRGFFALNNDASNAWTQSFQTGLPADTYCDVINGEPTSSGCIGDTVTVDNNGMATISIPAGKTFAIHLYSKSGTSPIIPSVVLEPNPESVGTNYQRTVVFMQKATTSGQNLFMLGGLDSSRNTGCGTTNTGCRNDTCAMSIVHQTAVSEFFSTYIDWAQNDQCLDWFGAEPNQGTYHGVGAVGTPMAYTTNAESDPAYNSLNTFGPGYWMIDVKMDCTKALNGWFELKGYVQNGGGWETNRQQSGCTGTAASGSPPYAGQNHFAKCGYLNIFTFDTNSCIINNF